MPIQFLDEQKTIGMIDFQQGVTIYVIDGAHRDIGIKGLMEAISTGSLAIRNTAGALALRK